LTLHDLDLAELAVVSDRVDFAFERYLKVAADGGCLCSGFWRP